MNEREGTSTLGNLNWKRGVVRLWLAVNIPLLAFFGYSAYNSYTCQRDMQEYVEFWYESLREVPDYKNAEKQFDESVALRDSCSRDFERDVRVLVAAPLGSLGALLSAAWIRRGFTSSR